MNDNEVKTLDIELTKIQNMKFDYRYLPVKDDNTDRYLLLLWEIISTFEHSLPELFANRELWLYRKFEKIGIEKTNDMKSILITKYTDYSLNIAYDFTIEINNFIDLFNKYLELKNKKFKSFRLIRQDNKVGIELLNTTTVSYEIKPLKIELMKVKTWGPAKIHYLAEDDENMDEYLFLVWQVIKGLSYDLPRFLRKHKYDSTLEDEEVGIEIVDSVTLRLGELAPYDDEERDYTFFIDIKFDNFLEVFNKYQEFKSLNIHIFQLTRQDNTIGIEILEESGPIVRIEL